MTSEEQEPTSHPSGYTEGELEVRSLAVERLTFFADAVVAIAITLLALDLPVPQGDTNSQIWHDILAHRDEYLAFAISFMVISAHWRGHHAVFRYVTYLDGRLSGLTMGWLFFQVVTPFATRVITGDGAFQFRFYFYVLVQIGAFVLFTLMVREIETRHLYRNDTPAHMFRHIYVRELGMATGFLISLPVALFTGWAYACWAAGPLAVNAYRRVRGRLPFDE
ncbi:MAG TPA: TMEM175 family protein [Pseudonocardiaceae bacterium]|nr:TMEM175 family protein [Pseudonocardiaceae bacterium]